jgi:hypothetical protein
VTSYRAEIDGLRAVSVILVVLFHLGVPIVPGGFVGVDVFFVISGYLISGILLDAMKARTFSITWFYERRIRRIIPALLAVIAFCLITGFLLLTPGDYLLAGDQCALCTGRHLQRLFPRQPDTSTAVPSSCRCCILGRSASRSNSMCCGRGFCSPVSGFQAAASAGR